MSSAELMDFLCKIQHRIKRRSHDIADGNLKGDVSVFVVIEETDFAPGIQTWNSGTLSSGVNGCGTLAPSPTRV